MNDAMIKQPESHFTYNAVEGVRREVNVPNDRSLMSRLLLTNRGALHGKWDPKARWIGGVIATRMEGASRPLRPRQLSLDTSWHS